MTREFNVANQDNTVRVFFSWQSDIPANTTLIRSAILTASQKIVSDPNYDVRILPDEATRGVSGSPNIPATIAKKIAKSDIFVADVSTINPSRSKNSRPVPNPNVVFELGFAAAVLGWERIVLLCNTDTTSFPGDLPFDFDRHRATPFDLPAASKKKSGEWKSANGQLGATLATAFASIIQNKPPRPYRAVSATEATKTDRDYRTLRTLLRYANPDLLFQVYTYAPPYLTADVFWFESQFSLWWDSPEVYIYHDELRDALNRLSVAWKGSLSFGSYYHDIGDRFKWMSGGSKASQTAFDDARKYSEDLKEASTDVFRIIAAEFIEIDLEEFRFESWRLFKRSAMEPEEVPQALSEE